MSIKENIRNEKRYERSLLSDAHIARLSDNFLSQWIKFSKELSYQSIGIYYPDHHEHFPETMPEWTISVICAECLNNSP